MEAWEKNAQTVETQGGQNLYKLLWHMLKNAIILLILKLGTVKKISEPVSWKLKATTRLS